MDFLNNVAKAGVIGAGGAGFPTHAKLNADAEYILMNGAECEPLLRVDQQLMEMYPDKIVQGFVMAGKHVKASKAIIGIKGKHKEVISLLSERIKALGFEDYVEIGILPDIYPAGDEQVLVYQLTGRIVPEGGIPIKVGCVVVNSETCLNIFNAANDIAVTQKYVTIAGDVPKRLTVKVPVGTPIKELLTLSGIENFDEYAVIDGGPMMGPVMAEIGGYVTKKTKGLVVLKKEHYLIRKKTVSMQQARKINKATCEQCRMCTDMCPRFLLGHNMQPHKIMRSANYSLGNIEDKKIAQLCCQCNMCELFACPAGLHPKMANLYFKGELAKENIRYTPVEREYKTRNSREFRLVSSKRLIARIGLSKFDKAAPMEECSLNVEKVRIMLSQHVGAPAVPTVEIGQTVEEGQLIGIIPENALGANVHSSIKGTVTEIAEKYIEIRRI